MKEYGIEKIRNIALVGHSGSGKTSLAEAALFASGAVNRMGKTEDGNTVSDFDPEEVRRTISISTSLIPVEWSGHKLNLLDTPGYADFVGEVISALRAVEAAVLVVDAQSGIEVGTEIAWQYMDDLNLPRIVVINKVNREHANWTKVLDDLATAFPARFVPLQVPVGQALDFKGVYGLLDQKASLGQEGKAGDVGADVEEAATRRRDAMVEAAADSDDELMLKFLEDEKLTDQEIRGGIVAGAKAGAFVPVLFTAATDVLGVRALLDQLTALVASPADAPAREATHKASGETVQVEADPGGPLVTLVFKTQADPYVGRLQYLRVLSGAFEADSRVYNVNQGEEE